MGVPKFYRWISERYPCLSQVVKEHEMPDFDNLYLDMNGIIHSCSHPNDEDPHFRISEDKIFKDIFHYIEFLFQIIKPKKFFFMAVDGVAPRAKMNQQRGRRFRTAKEAENAAEAAKMKGEVLPSEPRFDSNCITPGTEFMARLHEQLKYFVTMKISTDKLWQNVQVYLSGHETPGEGEHKIMDFIRYQRSQPDYDPNTTHCLYGLDADLIMLGLCSHEPYFSLLREEVHFGKKALQKRTVVPEEVTFHLLHLSLMRDYLVCEFSSLKETLPFKYDFEKILDDWVLMGFLVGNDFIPNLPHFHIHQNTLPLLYKAYIEVLPKLDGYLNEGGFLNLKRFQSYMTHLSQFDYDNFSESWLDFKYLEGKSGSKSADSKSELKNRKANRKLEEKISKECEIDLVTKNRFTPIDEGGGISISTYDEEDDESEELFQLEFSQHKRDYYINKLEYENVTQEVLREQAYGYVRAIQWNLHYYYNGVVSWSWFYPHHYAPYISDIKDFSDLNLEYTKGKPFLPFQQLLAVLPGASKNLLPKAYQNLMCSENSLMKDYYPVDFKTDLNGKTHDWEALVLIPFINEELLLKCTSSVENSLTKEEKVRNKHGPNLLYRFSEASLGTYKSPLPGHFTDIEENHAFCEEIDQDKFRFPVNKIKKGLHEGIQLNIYHPGFPTLQHINYSAELKNEDVAVFKTVSHKDNMMITIISNEEDINDVADRLLGQCIYVGWPHLQEAFVTSVSTEQIQCSLTTNKQRGKNTKYEKRMLSNDEASIWQKQASAIKEHYYRRLGIHVGEIHILVYVKHFNGFKCICSENGKVEMQKQWMSLTTPYTLQTTIKDLSVYTLTKIEITVEELFPQGSVCFMLGHPYYGCMGEVIESNPYKNKGYLRVNFLTPDEPDLHKIIYNERNYVKNQYFSGYTVAQQLGIASYLLSRITGAFLIQTSPKESTKPNRVNIGLNLKFNKKNEEVPGYTKKINESWMYTQKTVDIMKEYLERFPELFDRIMSFIDCDVVFAEDLFPNDEKQHINEIISWLKSQPCMSVERQQCGTEALDEGVIKAIEDLVKITKDQNPKGSEKYTELLVKPHNLYNSVSCQLSIPDDTATYQLYDRVINVQGNSLVPLGLRGTVIGILKSSSKETEYFCEVVFDEKFENGLTLNCSPGCGYRMLPSSLINFSHDERQRNVQKGSPTKAKKSPYQNKERSYYEHSSDQSKKNIANQCSVVGMPSYHLLGKTPEESSLKKSFSSLPGKSLQPHQANSPFYNTNSASNTLNYYRPHYYPDTYDNKKKSKVPSTCGEFVTPKVDLKSAHPRSYKPGQHAKQETQNFEYMWEDLKKMSLSDLKYNNQHMASQNSYGRQVSVDELFRDTHEREQLLRSRQQSSVSGQLNVSTSGQKYNFQPHCLSYVSKLKSLVNSTMGGEPQYKYSVTGPLCSYQAEVSLPDGSSFFSDPHPNQSEATESAAEQALVHLQAAHEHHIQSSCVPKTGGSSYPFHLNLSFLAGGKNFYQQRVPDVQFCRASSSSLPLVYKQQYPNQLSVVRHPPPPPTAQIPESFVLHNYKILKKQGGNEHTSDNHDDMSTSSQIIKDVPSKSPVAFPLKDSSSHVIHESNKSKLSVKNSATYKESSSTANRESVNSAHLEHLFVPLQVTKQNSRKSIKGADVSSESQNVNAAVTKDDSPHLMHSEWPPLPCFIQDQANVSKSVNEESTIDVTSGDISKESRTYASKASKKKTPRKSRLAVKFDNAK